jgi:hypothetical protein
LEQTKAIDSYVFSYQNAFPPILTSKVPFHHPSPSQIKDFHLTPQQVATVEDVDRHDLPSAPPSFQAATSSPSDLQHKNDETAAPIMPQSERVKNLMDRDDWESPKNDTRDLEAVRDTHDASRQVQMRWKIAIVVFVMWFSATVVYGVARKMCMKKA